MKIQLTSPVVLLILGAFLEYSTSNGLSNRNVYNATLTEDIHITTSYKWNPGGKKYPTGTTDVIITVDEGYYISVTINKLDLFSSNGDFLSINSGDITKEDESKTRIFTYYLKDPIKILCNTDKVRAYFFVNGENDGSKVGTEILFERLGTGTTTTEKTTTGIPRPTAQPNVTTTIDVTISGRSDDDYDEEAVKCLKTAIAGMAKEYCRYQDIIPKEEITASNVVIKNLKQCTYSWPDFETCVFVRFELPLFLDEESSWQGYQLTSDHLTLMWDTYADKYLKECALEIYKEPNIKKIVTWWLVAVAIATVAFVVVLIFLKKFGWRIHSGIRRRKLSDTASIVSNKRESVDSFAPHYLQETPDFFENILPMYKP